MEDLQLVQPEVTLKTIQFKTSASQPAIASAVCVLSNDRASPIIEKRGTKMDHTKTRTLALGQAGAIRKILVKTSTNMINAIAFLDKDGQRIESYEAQESDGLEESTIELGPSEEIFGVYGVKDSSDHFSSFGFIAKIPLQSDKIAPALKPVVAQSP